MQRNAFISTISKKSPPKGLQRGSKTKTKTESEKEGEIEREEGRREREVSEIAAAVYPTTWF